MKEINIIYVAALTLLIAGFLTKEVASFGCYSCWSNVTAECAVGPVVDAPREECPETDLSCVTAIVDQKTVRGCSGSVSLPSGYPLQENCTYEYCNSNIYPTNRLYCFKCQGSQCAEPKGKSRPCLNYSPNDECYTDVIDVTNTSRGCLSDGNYTATEYTTTCKENLCNNQPSEETLECLTCTSNNTLDCIRPADGSGECQIPLNSTCSLNFLLGRPANCYTYQNGDYVERGCDTPVNGYLNYTVCSENNCNADCIPQSVCYTCDSGVDPDCSTDISKMVPENCTTQAISSCFTCLGEVDNDITFRGCSSSIQQPLSPELSTICQEEYCNLEIYPTNRLSCFKCSGEDCSAPSGNSRPCVHYDPNDKCYTEVINATNAIRGCLSDGNFTVSAQTILCSGDMCNDDVSTGGTCFDCNSKFGENCYDKPNETSVAMCSDEDVHTCFTCINHSDGVVSRGCGSASTNSSDQCTTCNDSICNIETILECYECSSENVENCNEINNTTTTTTCLTHCVEKVTELGITERGCQAENFNCEPSDLYCNMCPDSLCNDQETPKGSFKCHECDDASCAYLNGTNTLEICAILGTGICYQYYDKSGSMVRGCMGDNNTDNCLAANEECYQCRTSGCNDIPLTRPSNLSCIQCTSLDGSSCAWGFEASKGRSCDSDIIFYQTPVCYTATISNLGTLVSRGCLANTYDCTDLGVRCEFCSTDNCNIGNIIWQQCLQCTSENSDSCEDGTYQATRCPGDLMTYEQRGCFMMQEGKKITRGCKAVLTQSEQEYCSSSNSKNCTVCYEQGCNNQKGNSSTTIQASFYLMMLLALFSFLHEN